MPTIQLDLEDGLPEITLRIDGRNLARFIEFMTENDRNEKRLNKADEVVNALYESGELSADSERKVQEYTALEIETGVNDYA